MDPNWDDLRVVRALVQQGSLAAAAADIGVNYTTVARRVARVEAALDTVLFERLADGYAPTDAARLVATHAEEMQVSSDALLRALARRDPRLTGPLTVTAPQLVIAHLLAPVLAAFTAAHPQVTLQMRATNDILDLTRREADLAIRVSRAPGDTLTGQRLTEQATASFAAPGWAKRIAEDPGGAIDWIVLSDVDTLPDVVLKGYPGSRIRYRFDDMVAMVGAAEAGLGVVRVPMFLGRALPGLVQVPCLPPEPYAEIWMVAHRDVWPAGKVAAFRAMVRAAVPQMRSACLP